MNGNEVVETSDDEELELKLLEAAHVSSIFAGQTTPHRRDGQSPRKRRKLYHDSELDIQPFGTPVPASSVTWPPTSSSPNTSPKSSSLLQTPPQSHRLSSSVSVIQPYSTGRSSGDFIRPKLGLKNNEPDDELPLVLSSPSFISTSNQVELPDVHASFLGMTNPDPSPTPRPLDELPIVSSSPPDMINTNDVEPSDIHERLLSSTPPPSSLEARIRSPSPDPMLLFDMSPSQPIVDLARQDTPIHKNQRPGDLSPRMDLSPHIGTQSPLRATSSLDSQVPSTSPRQHMSPPLPAQHSPQNSLPHDSPIISLDRGLQVPIIQDAGPDVALSNDVDIASISRYPLRKRAPAQLKPYTVEKYQYKQALSANPDAIVKVSDLERVSRDHYDHTDDHFDESQAPWQSFEEAQGDSHDKRRHLQTTSRGADPTQSASEERLVQHSELLQDLPTSDDEESKSMQRFSKEAKRLERQRRKARSEEERQARSVRGGSERTNVHTRPKAFPVKRPSRSTSRSLSISLNESLPSPSCSITHSDTPRSRSPVISLSPTPDTSTHSPHYIDDDGTDNFDVQPGARGSVDLSDPETQSGHSSEVDDEDVPPKKAKMPKDVKTLSRMYPQFMIEKLVASSSEAFRPKSKTKWHTKDSSGSENEETTVLPGRSRSGWSTRSWKEIQGNTESSDDQHTSDQDSSSDNESVQMQSGSRMRSSRQDAHDFIDLTGNVEEDEDDAEDEEDDDGVDDREIQAYLVGDSGPKEQVSPTGHMREESLIDWMLTRTRTIGGPSRPKTRKRPPDRSHNPKRAGPSRYKIDVTIQGGRGKRQTRLNFDGHIRKKPASHKSRKGNYTPPWQARSGSIDVEANDERDHVQPVTEFGAPPPEKDRKQRQRERRARAKGNGLHIFTSDSTHFVSGRRKGALMTLNIEEDGGFSQAIAPLSQDSGARPLQSARIANTDRKEPISERSPSPGCRPDMHEVRMQRRETQSVRLDCGIEVLQSGLSFSAKSYIRKGWLHELIGVIRGEFPPPLPTKIIFHGMELGPDSSVDDLNKSLKQVFDELFDIVTSLVGAPEIEEEQEWRGVKHAINQSLSWFLASATEPDIELLRNTVQEQVLTFVSRMRNQSFDPLSVDTFMLSICWFAVEISARLDLPTKFPTSSMALGQSVPLLMNYLWGYGAESVMVSFKEGMFPNGPILPQYVAELWVSLFHLLDSRNIQDGSSKKSVHPFSFFLQETLESTPRQSKNPFKASEWVWHSVFSLCALMQFSVHGMTTSISRLPASWDLIVYALKQVRLTVDADADRALSQQSLHQRDFYAQCITERCFLLRSRWHWQLDEVSSVLDRLSKVFQSRNFAGLHHELEKTEYSFKFRKPDYPFFLLHNDWSVFEKLEPGDTAFVVFLKLLFQAVQVGCNETATACPLSLKAKKMLSMAISVTKLPFSKKIPTAVQDLSMLHNRLSAVAVAIYLDPTSHVQRMRTARSYVNFSDADDTTRYGVILGMIYLAIMLKKAQLPTDSISHWATEMATTLVNEHKMLEECPSIGSETEHKKILNRLYISVELLVGAVRQIFQEFQADSDYPELALLEALDPIIKATNLANQPTTAEQIRQMLQVFINARRALLPSQRPPIKPTTRESQESQDDYPTMDLDYDDPEFLAALDAYDSKVPTAFTDKEEKLNAYMSSPLSPFWWVWHNLNTRIINSPSPTKGEYIQIEVWLECWLDCADVMVHAGRNTKSWQRYLNMRENWKGLSESLRKRLDFSLMKRLLKIDPMTYLGYKNMYLETLLTALVSTDPMNERDFIHLVLEIDGGQHPLLVGLSIEELSNPPNKQEPSDILRGIIKNLAVRLADMTTSPDDREGVIEFCIKIFQAMKRNSSELLKGSPERQRYNTWCREIAQTVQAFRELRHERLLPWKNWERGLD